jgi:2-polyprenyl-6-methoxyphenol hydroxylase-like FAD-dependent oxidoreductase
MPRAAIIGAGPIGLEAALAAGEHGFDVRVYERAPTVGGHVRRWGHVSLFTPWDMNVSPRMAVALGDCAPTGAHLPTGAQLVDELLEPVAQTQSLAGRVQTSTTVVHVAREGLLKNEEVASPERARRAFRLLVAGPDGEQRLEQADIVIDATGTYGNPNRLGGGGIDAVNERAFEARVTRFLVPARRFAGRRARATVRRPPRATWPRSPRTRPARACCGRCAMSRMISAGCPVTRCPSAPLSTRRRSAWRPGRLLP